MKRLLPISLVAALTWLAPACLAPARAADWDVPNRAGAIAETLAQAADGDTLRLAPGEYAETLVLDRSVTLDGQGHATLDGQGKGSVITVTGPGVTVQNLTVVGSGSSHQEIDSGIKLTKTAKAPQILNNVLSGQPLRRGCSRRPGQPCAGQPDRGAPGPAHERPRQRGLCLERAGSGGRRQSTSALAATGSL